MLSTSYGGDAMAYISIVAVLVDPVSYGHLEIDVGQFLMRVNG